MRIHLSIDVKNVPESVAFYSKVFQAPPQKQTDVYAKFDLKEPLFNFSMQSSPEKAPSRVSHLGIEVTSTEDVNSWRSRLEALGIVTRPEEQTDCCYALQDKVWFADPDGNEWEVFVVHQQLPIAKAKAFADSSCCVPKAKEDEVAKSGSGCCG